MFLRTPFEMCRFRKTIDSGNGFVGWEIAISCALVLAIILGGVVLLKYNYKSCLDKGYSLTECVFNRAAV